MKRTESTQDSNTTSINQREAEFILERQFVAYYELQHQAWSLIRIILTALGVIGTFSALLLSGIIELSNTSRIIGALSAGINDITSAVHMLVTLILIVSGVWLFYRGLQQAFSVVGPTGLMPLSRDEAETPIMSRPVAREKWIDNNKVELNEAADAIDSSHFYLFMSIMAFIIGVILYVYQVSYSSEGLAIIHFIFFLVLVCISSITLVGRMSYELGRKLSEGIETVDRDINSTGKRTIRVIWVLLPASLLFYSILLNFGFISILMVVVFTFIFVVSPAIWKRKGYRGEYLIILLSILLLSLITIMLYIGIS